MITKVSLPLELWDEIAHGVGSTSDLLSLALVCRDLSALILSHHIHYRHIRCNLSRNDVWQHLAKHRHCARGVRSIELVDEHEDGIRLPPSSITLTVLPKTIDTSTTALFIRSLAYMTALEAFQWKAATPRHLNDISRFVVANASDLRALRVDFAWYQDDDGVFLPGYGNNLNTLPLWNLTNLTKVILNDICRSAQEMLVHKCPNLEDLSLAGYSHCSLIIENGSWKQLRRLSLRGFLTFFPPHTTYSKQNIITIEFFRRHPNLECLHLACNSLPSVPPPYDLSSLPDLLKLRSVSWQCYMTSRPSYFLAESCLSRLLHYKVAAFELDPTCSMQNLETFQITLDQWIPLRLTQLLQRGLTSFRKISFDGSLDPIQTKRFIEMLVSHCTNLNLTHIYLSALQLSEFSEVEQCAQSLSELKTLLYIQIPFERRLINIGFDRDLAGKYLGYHFISLDDESEMGQRPSKWGDHFNSI